MLLATLWMTHHTGLRACSFWHWTFSDINYLHNIVSPLFCTEAYYHVASVANMQFIMSSDRFDS